MYAETRTDLVETIMNIKRKRGIFDWKKIKIDNIFKITSPSFPVFYFP